MSASGTSEVERPLSRVGRRLRRAWDWYTDLGFGAWVLGGGVLVGLALVTSLVVGHGDTPDSSCQAAASPASVIDRYDGRVLTRHQAAVLHRASTQLHSDVRTAAGHTQDVLTEAAQVAGAARAGHVFDAGFTYGRFESVCDFSGGGALVRN